MSLLKKGKALSRKFKSVIKNPEAAAEGMYFYHNKNKTIEALKDERAKECDNCESIEFDDFEPIKDNNEAISGKMCGECFCSLPYLLRQTKKSCELKKWK